MKLSNEALIEIISIVQDGLLGVKDASQGLRELDLKTKSLTTSNELSEQLVLSQRYIDTHPRATPEEEETEELN